MKKQQLSKTTERELVTKSHQKMRNFMVKNGSEYNPKALIDKLTKQFESKEQSEHFFDNYQKAIFALGLQTHAPVADSVKEEYRYFLTEMAQSVEREYDCKTTIEKSLAEAIALNHIRIISLSKTFNAYTCGEVVLSKERTEYYELIGKELDRAHRQLNNSILTLRQIKIANSPLKVNAKTAYFAQNQQINNYDKQDEINERQ